MAFYLVLAKCGHVGRRLYMPILFPVEAENGRDAAKEARKIPRVKRDHKDAILDCVEVTYEDYMIQKFNRKPTDNELCQIAEIISWNLWQMDGLTFTAPYSEKECEEQQMLLVGYEDENPEIIKEPVFCIIKDWSGKGKKIEYRTLLKKG